MRKNVNMKLKDETVEKIHVIAKQYRKSESEILEMLVDGCEVKKEEREQNVSYLAVTLALKHL